MKKNYLFVFTFFIMGNLCFTGCELLEDILKDHPASTRKQLIGLWKNDSLVTKYYEDGMLVNTVNQSLEGYSIEIKADDTYTNTNPAGDAYFSGTWDLVKVNNTDQILLDANTVDERGYNIISLTKERLVTNRKVSLSESAAIEYTFSYNK